MNQTFSSSFPSLPFPSLTGIVVRGLGQARTLGFPTANVSPDPIDSLTPLCDGVYSCWVEFECFQYQGMGYLEASKRSIFEVHLFHFEGDLYGHSLLVRPHTYIRPPSSHFDDSFSLDQIKACLQEDAARCLGSFVK